ncbi:hypothetical protein N657DRAFT_492749 [Parathielavia appendiculata]|uniref:Uncharacterized protein n=1 Tax=Parathielavia appendiculata TaxID=2587402 RepID=A0AAN6TWR7_9PEZI|nr:hypothetical protein N657DRAFT_492749 [Parathielavia appendiculata]
MSVRLGVRSSKQMTACCEIRVFQRVPWRRLGSVPSAMISWLRSRGGDIGLLVRLGSSWSPGATSPCLSCELQGVQVRMPLAEGWGFPRTPRSSYPVWGHAGGCFRCGYRIHMVVDDCLWGNVTVRFTSASSMPREGFMQKRRGACRGAVDQDLFHGFHLRRPERTVPAI